MTTTPTARRLDAVTATAAAAVMFLPTLASAHPATAAGAPATAPAHPATAADQVAVLQADADAAVAAGLPGYAAQVSDGRSTRYVRTGVAVRTTGRPISPADAFDIASITKPFG